MEDKFDLLNEQQKTEVMNFLQITGTDDINTAVSYLEMASFEVAVWFDFVFGNKISFCLGNILLIDFIILHKLLQYYFLFVYSYPFCFMEIPTSRMQSICISNSKRNHQPPLLLCLSNHKDQILRVSYLQSRACTIS